jgi:AcrR family transcriptional regulator
MARQQSKPPARRRRTWRRDRAGKQKNLIRAFDRVLNEKGVQGLGVNAVIKEAGVGKNLLYKYFGDLKGLARAWGRTTELLPGESEIAGEDKRAYERLSTPEQISRNYRQYAAALRRRPRTLEILANELVHPNVLTAPLDDVRGDLGKALEKYFTRPQEYARNDTVAIMVIMLAAVTYLALRSRTAPQYLWMRLDTERGWREADAMIDLIIRRVLGNSRPAKARGKNGARAPAGKGKGRTPHAKGRALHA